jgi:hypothetical protein
MCVDVYVSVTAAVTEAEDVWEVEDLVHALRESGIGRSSGTVVEAPAPPHCPFKDI